MMTESTGDSFEPPTAREFAHDDSNMSADEDEKFTYKDVLTGLGFAAVDGVATFYSLIFRQPVGRHVILVCDSSSCFLTGYETLKQALVEKLGVDYGATTADGRFTLLPVCCLGACAGAPALMIDGETFGPVTPEDLSDLLEGYE